VGHLHTLPYDDAFSDVSFPDSDQKIATRLGAADRLVTFDPPQPGPFKQDVKQLSLRFHQLPKELSLDVEPTAIANLPGEVGFEFNLGTARYRYDRFGLQRLKADSAATQQHGRTR
jgi:CRISPR-associated endonuclease/helicase Cas3